MNQQRTNIELKSDREIVVSRTFRARAHIVFDAWTKPEYVKRWWAPLSLGVSVVECEADVRPGGAYRYVLKHGEGAPFSFYGKYLEIERPTRLVYTSIFEQYPDSPVTVTTTFEERDGSTRLVSHELYPSKETRDAVIASGMEAGVHVTYDQLDALLASLGG